MAEKATPPILCFGEVLWDCLPRGLFPGGAPVNVAYHLQHHGLTAYPVTAVGDDFLGHELLRRLNEWGIDTRFVSVLPNKQTGVVQAEIQPDGSAKYKIVEDVAWDWIEPSGGVFELAAEGAAIVFGTLAQRTEHNRDRLAAVLGRMAGGLRVYDVNLRAPFDDPDLVARLSKGADLIKLNDEELHLLARRHFPTGTLESAARTFASNLNCRRLCVTGAAHGAGMLDGGKFFWVPGKPVDVRDTIGAGDSFLASLIAGVLGGILTPGEILKRACRLGEFVASQDGATPHYSVDATGHIHPAKLMSLKSVTVQSARRDFHRARQRAALEQIMAALTGKSAALLSYEEIRGKLRAVEGAARRLEDVPIDAIVGSVERYDDFTRSFLPRHDSFEDRWTSVEMATSDQDRVPPVELYRLEDAYFVRDGHQRISIARQSGATHVEAYVTEVQSGVPLEAAAPPDRLIVKAEQGDFLMRTHLNELRPGANMASTTAGHYGELLEHIDVHRYFMGLDQKRDVPYEEAVTHWYDTVYSPIVEIIREEDILRDFPGRTEADLYLWISKHRAALGKEIGWDVGTEKVARDFAAHFSPKPERLLARVGERILSVMRPPDLKAAPAAEEARRRRIAAGSVAGLFADMLIAVGADSAQWQGLDQALLLAKMEKCRLHGLHVVKSKSQIETEETRSMVVTFNRRCTEAGVPGRLAVEAGDVADTICDRARWTDLVVVDYNSAAKKTGAIGENLNTIIHRGSRPVLVVPRPAAPFERILLAYDGSPKSEEALFVATHLADTHGIPLFVLVMAGAKGSAISKMQARVREYLGNHGVDGDVAEWSGEGGTIISNLLDAIEFQNSDLVVLGARSSLPGGGIGGALEDLVSACDRCILICR